MIQANNLIKEILVGGGIAVLAAILFNATTFGQLYHYGIGSIGMEIKITATLISLLYTWHIAIRSEIRGGWGVVALLFTSFTFLSFVSGVNYLIHFAAQLLWVWLLRSLFLRHGLVKSIMDGTVILFATIWSLWVYAFSNSVLLGVWAFFIAQSIHIYLPEFSEKRKESHSEHFRNKDIDRFSSSYQAAEAALRELAKRS